MCFRILTWQNLKYATTDEELGHVTKFYDLEYGGIYQEMTEEFCLENDVLSDDEEFTL